MQNINNSIIKTVRSLSQKKDRDDERLFVAEGTKCVRDTWGAFSCRWLICTQGWHDRLATAQMHDKIVIANNRQMSQVSQFSTPSDVVAVYEQPAVEIDDDEVRRGLNIVLDNIQDPGNLGTIIRLADWYGIRNIFASKGTVDVYNHKVVQATMGAIGRVKVHYCDLERLLAEYDDIPVYGTFLNGDNIYSAELEPKGFVIFGNEGKGISAALEPMVHKRLLIPAARRDGARSESLNVGIAAAITISEIMRSTMRVSLNTKH